MLAWFAGCGCCLYGVEGCEETDGSLAGVLLLVGSMTYLARTCCWFFFLTCGQLQFSVFVFTFTWVRKKYRAFSCIKCTAYESCANAIVLYYSRT